MSYIEELWEQLRKKKEEIITILYSEVDTETRMKDIKEIEDKIKKLEKKYNKEV